MNARMVLLGAAAAGLLIGSFSGASELPTMNPPPEQPWERMLRPEPPADPYAVAYTSAPQDYSPPNWMEPQSPVYAWEIEHYAARFVDSLYDDLPLAEYVPEYVPEPYPPLDLDLPGLAEARAEIRAMESAEREARAAASAAAGVAASVEEMSRRERPSHPTEQTAALENGQDPQET